MTWNALILPALLAGGPSEAETPTAPVDLVGSSALRLEYQPGPPAPRIAFGALGQDAPSAPPDPATHDDDPPVTLPETLPEAPPEYGARGTRRWNVHGGLGSDVTDEKDWFGEIGLGYSHFIADGLSLDLELNGLYFNQRTKDAWGLNGNLLVRWHFLRKESWSMYFDFGAGIMGSTEQVPPDGTNFNFTPQAGLGLTWDVGEGNRMMFGARWHHVSNANTSPGNPGRDSVYVYAGLSFPF